MAAERREEGADEQHDDERQEKPDGAAHEPARGRRDRAGACPATLEAKKQEAGA